jgi:hypothetical protein
MAIRIGRVRDQEIKTLEHIASRIAHYGQIEMTADDLIYWLKEPAHEVVSILDEGEMLGAVLSVAGPEVYEIIESYMELKVWHDRARAFSVFEIIKNWLRRRSYARCEVLGCARQLEALRACRDNGLKITEYRPKEAHPLGIATVRMEVAL